MSKRIRLFAVLLAAGLFLAAPEAPAAYAHDCPAGMSCHMDSDPCMGNLVGGYEFNFGMNAGWFSIVLFSFDYCFYNVMWADGSTSMVGLVWAE